MSTLRKHTIELEQQIIRPAYDVEHPAETVFSDDFETSAASWAYASPSTTSARTSTVTGGTPHTGRYAFFVGSPSPYSHKVAKTVSSLEVGRSYTLTAWAGLQNASGTAKAGVTGKSYGTTVTGWGSGALTWKQVTYTFTATATSHQLILESTANGTGTNTPVFWDDITLTKDAWTEHFPAVSEYVDLDIKEATITLDESWAPFVQARVVIPTPPEELLEFIDPRENLKVLMYLREYDVEDTIWSDRNLKLRLRSRTVDHNAGTLSLEYASDEAYLMDYARVATTADSSYRTYESSLRSLTNAVLTTTLGTTLATDDLDDADLTATWSLTNEITNPAPTSATGYAAGSGTSAISYVTTTVFANSVRWTASATTTSYLNIGSDMGVTPGATYTVKGRLGSSVSRAVGFLVRWKDQAGNTIKDVATATVTTSTSAWTTLTAQVTAPPTASSVALFARSTTNTTGQFHYASQLMWYADDESIAYFDGGTTDTGSYTYDWVGDANASASTRTAVVERPPSLFSWEPGVSAWDFLSPLVQAAGLRLFCDGFGVWHLVDPTTWTVAFPIEIEGGVNATSASDTITRNGDTWFDSVVLKYSWIDKNNIPRVAYDSAGTAGGKTLRLEHNRPSPGLGAAAALLARSQARGRTFDVSALSYYYAGPGCPVDLTLPSTPPQSGVISALTWTFPGDEMTVTTRNLVESP